MCRYFETNCLLIFVLIVGNVFGHRLEYVLVSNITSLKKEWLKNNESVHEHVHEQIRFCETLNIVCFFTFTFLCGFPSSDS